LSKERIKEQEREELDIVDRDIVGVDGSPTRFFRGRGAKF